MTTIKLHGKLASAVGKKEWNLKIKSVSEAMHAINSQTSDGVRKFFLKRENGLARYEVIVDDQVLDASDDSKCNELLIKREGMKKIEIVPLLEGSFLGFLGVILGVGGLLTATSPMGAMMSIMLIAQGISNLLSESPPMPEQRKITNPSSDPTALANSYLFNGPTNVLNEGGPVPLGYGRLIVGSQTIMSSYDVKKVLIREAGRVR
jgi:predicted phage tail protein